MSLTADLRYLIEYDILRVKRILRTLIEELPTSFEARILLGDAHLRALELDLALDQYRAALRIDKNSRLATSKIALCGIYIGAYVGALGGFERLHTTARDPQSLALAGLMLHRLGRVPEALDRYRRLHAIVAPDAPILLFARQAEIRALRQLGRVDEADVAARALHDSLQKNAPKAASDLLMLNASYDFHEWSAIADKGALAELLARHGDQRNNDLRFPETFVLEQQKEAFAAFAGRQPPGTIYIVKPRAGQGGQSIFLTDRPEDAIAARDAVVQRYIDTPYLVEGRKAHLRIYVLIVSVDPLRFYVYDDGIVRFAPHPYQRGEDWLRRSDIHVTNTALHRNNSLLVVSQDPSQEDTGHVWTLRAYLRRIASDGGDAEAVFSAIGRLAGRFVLTLQAQGFFARQIAKAPSPSFAAKMFGLDVLLDQDLRPWLIEIQRSPAWRGVPLVNRVNDRIAATLALMTSSPLIEPDLPESVAMAIRSDPNARAERELALEALHQGGFVRIVHEPGNERDVARVGRAIPL